MSRPPRQGPWLDGAVVAFALLALVGAEALLRVALPALVGDAATLWPVPRVGAALLVGAVLAWAAPGSWREALAVGLVADWAIGGLLAAAGLSAARVMPLSLGRAAFRAALTVVPAVAVVTAATWRRPRRHAPAPGVGLLAQTLAALGGVLLGFTAVAAGLHGEGAGAVADSAFLAGLAGALVAGFAGGALWSERRAAAGAAAGAVAGAILAVVWVVGTPIRSERAFVVMALVGLVVGGLGGACGAWLGWWALGRRRRAARERARSQVVVEAFE